MGTWIAPNVGAEGAEWAPYGSLEGAQRVPKGHLEYLQQQQQQQWQLTVQCCCGPGLDAHPRAGLPQCRCAPNFTIA